MSDTNKQKLIELYVKNLRGSSNLVDVRIKLIIIVASAWFKILLSLLVILL